MDNIIKENLDALYEEHKRNKYKLNSQKTAEAAKRFSAVFLSCAPFLFSL